MSFNARLRTATWAADYPFIMLLTGGLIREAAEKTRAQSHPLTAWSSRSEGKAVRTSTVCSRMRRRTHSTRSSPPLAMKAGIHSTLPLRLRSRRRKRPLHSSLARSWKARCTTEGFMVTRSVCKPTSWWYSSTGARLHLKGGSKQVRMWDSFTYQITHCFFSEPRLKGFFCFLVMFLLENPKGFVD